MDLGDELLARAKAEAEQLRSPALDRMRTEASRLFTPLKGLAAFTPGPSAEEKERLRNEASRLFDLLPEAPAYRRANDPARDKANELIPHAVSLLARLMAARDTNPDDQRLELLGRAVELHVRALAAISAGELAKGDRFAHEAFISARLVNRTGSHFHEVPDSGRGKVFDPATGASRFDPRPDATLSVKLFCPNQGCREPSDYVIVPRYAEHRFTCARCQRPFKGHFGEVKAIDARPLGSSGTQYLLELFEPGGSEARRLEFHDSSGMELGAFPRDQVVLLYAGTGSLGAVENLSSGRVLWVEPKGPCFMVTAVYGPEAPELDAFRSFRDRVLLPSAAGRQLVRGYYAAGPSLAAVVRKRPLLRAGTRRLLDAVHARLGR